MAPTAFSNPASAWAECDAMLKNAINLWRAELGRPIAIGISGAQGSGKSTLAGRLALQLRQEGCPAALLSLDDFYLPREERQKLAAEAHSLFVTRGVPGTHDLELAGRCLTALIERGQPRTVPIPNFDKAADDRCPEHQWRRIEAPVEILLFEGWCVGARPQGPAALQHPVNALEEGEDSEGRWRGRVNAALAGPYRDFFLRLDRQVFLRAPSFEIVAAWRGEQEAGLDRSAPAARPALDGVAMARFIAHYERLTRWMLEDEPADLVIDLDADRIPLGCRPGGGLTAC